MTLIFSSVDRHNYGDLLYPIIINKILFDKDNQEKANIYSFTEADSVGSCGYKVNSIAKYFSSKNATCDDIIIGGGDSLRVDKELLADHCSSIYNKSQKNSIVQKLRDFAFGKKDLIHEFILRFMTYDAPGPFILDNMRLKQLKKVIYCSCGVPFEFPEAVKEPVLTAFNNASLIYLRDEQSRKKLINIGVTNQIHVAPDLICTISDFYDATINKQKGLEILYRHGLEKGKSFLCFQANPSCRSSIEVIISELSKIKTERNIEIVLMPLGYCHDDDVVLKEIYERSNRDFIYADVVSIYEMLAIITASDIFIGTSMHGNITAFSYGIPHLVAPIGHDKMKGFLDIVNLSESLLLSSWTEMAGRLDYLDTLESDYFSSRAKTAKVKVYTVMQSISEQLSNHDK